MGKIPSNRPILGKDLDTIRIQQGILTADACWLFGLSITRWMQIVRQASEIPVKDPTLALLIRLLDNNPELSVIPRFPTAIEMFEVINSVQETDQKRFSLLFGSEASAANRWLVDNNTRQSPAVNRLMHYMKAALMSKAPDQRPALIDRWAGIVREEGQARGVPDVFRAGNWNPKRVAEMSASITASLPNGVTPIRKKGLASKSSAKVESDKIKTTDAIAPQKAVAKKSKKLSA